MKRDTARDSAKSEEIHSLADNEKIIIEESLAIVSSCQWSIEVVNVLDLSLVSTRNAPKT